MEAGASGSRADGFRDGSEVEGGREGGAVGGEGSTGSNTERGVAVAAAAERVVSEADRQRGEQRWLELEREIVAADADRQALRAELRELRQKCSERADAALTIAAGVTAEEAGGDSVRSTKQQASQDLDARLAEVKRQADERLTAIVAERDRSSKLTQELRSNAEARATLSKEKFQLSERQQELEAELSKTRRELDRLQQASAAQSKKLEVCQQELGSFAESNRALMLTKHRLREELEGNLESTSKDLEFYKKVAAEARLQQERLRHQLVDSEQSFRDQAIAFDVERSALEKKQVVVDEQLQRESERWKTSQEKLRESEIARRVAIEARDAALEEEKKQIERIRELEKELDQERRERESFLRAHIPGADAEVSPPEGFASLADLVREVSTLREQLCREKQTKAELQKVLLEVEQEIRTRYPLLLEQRDEAERLRHANAEFKQLMDSFVARIRDLEATNREVEAQKATAEKTVQILDAHAKDMAKQIAILVHKKESTSFLRPSQVEAKQGEDDFLTVAELAARNEELRLEVRKLEAKCEEGAKAELDDLKREREREIEEWTEHLAEKAEQMAELVSVVERLTRERDEAQQALELRDSAGESSKDVIVQPTSKEIPKEQFEAMRAEFLKCLEVLKVEARDARASETKIQQQLTTALAEAKFEKARCSHVEMRSQTAEEQLEEQNSKSRKLQKQVDTLKDSVASEIAARRKRESLLAKAREARDELDTKYATSQAKLQALEEEQSCWMRERAAFQELISELRSGSAKDAETQSKLRQQLEERFRDEEKLLREQLDAVCSRQKDLERLVDHLSHAKGIAEKEAQDARQRIAELETANARLSKQVPQSVRDAETIDRMGEQRESIGDILKAAEAQLKRSEAPREVDPRIIKLERQIALADERAQEHRASAASWQKMLADRETELQSLQSQLAGLQQEVEDARAQRAKRDSEAAEACSREEELQSKVQTLAREAAALQADLAAKDAEVAAARLVGEERLREAEASEAERAREVQSHREQAEELRQRYINENTAHRKNRDELNEVRQKLGKAEKVAKDAQAESTQLKDEMQRAKAAQSEETTSLQFRLEQTEKHVESLQKEVHAYQQGLQGKSDSGSGIEGALTDARVAEELKRTREQNSHCRELEVERNRLESELKTLRADVVDLQQRLASEQEQTLRLQAEARRENRAIAKASQFDALECEVHRLRTAMQSLEDRHEKDAEALAAEQKKRQVSEKSAQELTEKESDWARAREELEKKVNEWQGLYDELVLKFDAEQIRDFKALKAEKEQWQSEKQQMTEKAASFDALMKQHESLKKELGDIRSRSDQASRLNNKLSQDLKAKDQELSKTKEYFVKRFHDVSDENKKMKEELAILKASGKGSSSQGAMLRRAEDASKTTQLQADRAPLVSTDQQTQMARPAQGASHGADTRGSNLLAKRKASSGGLDVSGGPPSTASAAAASSESSAVADDRAPKLARTAVSKEALELGTQTSSSSSAIVAGGQPTSSLPLNAPSALPEVSAPAATASSAAAVNLAGKTESIAPAAAGSAGAEITPQREAPVGDPTLSGQNPRAP